MIDYVYRAKDLKTGQIVSAEVKAESPQAAAKLLTNQGLFALEVVPKTESNLWSRIGLKRHITIKDRVLFTRQLSTLLNAGLPIARALRTVQEQIGNPELRNIISSVTASVEGGSSLSAALGQYPKVFNQIYVALVEAGETSGKLDETLQRLALQQEKEAATISKIRSALIYPAIVLVLIVLVLVFMLATIVPEVAKLYASLHKSLPILTQVLLWVANFLRYFWYVVLIAIIGLVLSSRRLLRNPKILDWRDEAIMKLPLFGRMFKKLYMARFGRTMYTLLSSGVHMLEAMETTKLALGNRVVADDLAKAIVKVRGGKALSESLLGSTHFLQLVPQMTKIGEESGAIDDMLAKVAVYYEDEVDEEVKNLSTTMEPIIMVVLGGMVAFVLGAVLFPIYSLVGGGDLSNLK